MEITLPGRDGKTMELRVADKSGRFLYVKIDTGKEDITVEARQLEIALAALLIYENL